eukprot:CAMPEP_0205930146 /NCGR_PEP_ID=MMETSP1325-20131115/25712_1 /ASSEMBLY_ACC=CAM_ASM_000708 /TAXON_ID=236786 /ORGANISM="Florenciella sp., Strain RCC1007" /LENGTH=393 /DNA_ID=CAMNT_0053299473 /DNA_START=38 /DNA_END=1220 /DNA_ORIENTATION=+
MAATSDHAQPPNAVRFPSPRSPHRDTTQAAAPPMQQSAASAAPSLPYTSHAGRQITHSLTLTLSTAYSDRGAADRRHVDASTTPTRKLAAAAVGAAPTPHRIELHHHNLAAVEADHDVASVDVDAVVGRDRLARLRDRLVSHQTVASRAAVAAGLHIRLEVVREVHRQLRRIDIPRKVADVHRVVLSDGLGRVAAVVRGLPVEAADNVASVDVDAVGHGDRVSRQRRVLVSHKTVAGRATVAAGLHVRLNVAREVHSQRRRIDIPFEVAHEDRVRLRDDLVLVVLRRARLASRAVVLARRPRLLLDRATVLTHKELAPLEIRIVHRGDHSRHISAHGDKRPALRAARILMELHLGARATVSREGKGDVVVGRVERQVAHEKSASHRHVCCADR